MIKFISPNWPAPKNVFAYTTTRGGGFSEFPYESLNLGLRAGDSPEKVAANRQLLSESLNLPSNPFWLKQQHTNIAIELTTQNCNTEYTGDASFTITPGLVCAVLTADCIPLLICDTQGTIIAAIHAGWRAIAAGIIESAINAMNFNPKNLIAWLGPAIGPNAFKVKDDMRDIFITHDPNAKKAFVEYENQWLANIYLLAKQRLTNCGVDKIFGGEYCTYTQNDLFFSYRREGPKSGRMASVIWLG